MPDPDGLLDPSDWPAFRALAHESLDETLDWLGRVRDEPSWRGVTDASRYATPTLPEDGAGAHAVVREFLDFVRPHTLRTVHPRWWGYVAGAGTPVGALSELFAGALNLVALGGDQAPMWIEKQVLSWAKDMTGLPATASGVLVNGASAATSVALAVAMRVHEPNVARDGVTPGLRLYGSDQTHSCVPRAADLLGLGRGAFRTVPSDDAFRIDLADLAACVAEDRAAGRRPFAVVASAGTVDTGAVDPLPELADFCAEKGMWLHIDGALGAPLGLSPRFRSLKDGMGRADSIALDFHKWLSAPFSAGCVLVRDADAHRRAFQVAASYTTQLDRGLSAGDTVWRDYSPDLSRPFWALKVWMTLKAHGRRRFVELFDRNLAQARRLGELVAAAPDLELLAPVELNVVCFRFVAPDRDLDALNRTILMDLQESGEAVLTQTLVRGRFALRACIANHRTRDDDLDFAVALVRRLGAAAAAR